MDKTKNENADFIACATVVYGRVGNVELIRLLKMHQNLNYEK